MKLNQPLVVGTVATGNEKNIVVVGLGNKGFKSIKISDILVNNNEQPQKVKVQVSNPLEALLSQTHLMMSLKNTASMI